ncbi:MAG: hypothetical protein AB1486_01990 [Planctomycetota bacterium]
MNEHWRRTVQFNAPFMLHVLSLAIELGAHDVDNLRSLDCRELTAQRAQDPAFGKAEIASGRRGGGVVIDSAVRGNQSFSEICGRNAS